MKEPASVILATNASNKVEVLINFYSLFLCPFFPRLFWQEHLDSSLLTCLPLASFCPNPLHVMVSSFCAQEVAVFHVTDNYCFKRILLTFCQKLNNPSLSLSYPLVFSLAGNCANCVELSANRQQCSSLQLSLLNGSRNPGFQLSPARVCVPQGWRAISTTNKTLAQGWTAQTLLVAHLWFIQI